MSLSDANDGTDADDPRLTAVCEGGVTVGCENFTAIDGGVLLTADPGRDRVIGFVPYEELRFVVPAAVARRAIDGTDDLERLPGLAETYARRLRAAGYASMADLAGADADAHTHAPVEAMGAGEEQFETRIERAAGAIRSS